MTKRHPETIHLVFKTHLDIGFTALARDVKAQYFDALVPGAMDVADSLRRAGRPERFVWTTGSWLIYEYLEQASTAERGRMERAIDAGDITWHALPFTAHSELMDASLFRFGLSLSQELDGRFGRQTIAGKMTDVPGHTRAIVPLLAEARVRLLHIGVNPASTPPDVPSAFVWQGRHGSDLTVIYGKGEYGGLTVLPRLGAALAIDHTLDNVGPQSADHVIKVFRDLGRRYPDAVVSGSTLNAFAEDLFEAAPDLPGVTREIGDTWIHGVGTDPTKIRRFRELCRLRNEWLADGTAAAMPRQFASFSRSLIMVPEHTWGLDEKEYTSDRESYSARDFARARRTPGFVTLEASWREQRAYIDEAVAALGDSSHAEVARERLASTEPAMPTEQGLREAGAGPFETAFFSVGFDPADGALVRLVDKQSGRDWASGQHPLGRLVYEVFSQLDYDRYLDQYQDPEERWDWFVQDFSKPGIERAVQAHESWNPRLESIRRREDDTGVHFLLDLAMPDECTGPFGAPGRFSVQVSLPTDERALSLDIQWSEKSACRLPEAVWVSFVPKASDPAGWALDKMGEYISPLEVVPNGNRKLHAVGAGVRYRGDDGQMEIESMDAPLVAPGERSLLDFNNRQPPVERGMHFNLHNNVWGTNFPMWFEDDARFRFVLRFP